MAAENAVPLKRRGRPFLASMRPRRMAAENAATSSAAGAAAVASMRPRRMAAENAGRGGFGSSAGAGFNEAAAHGRGKPRPPTK